MSPKPIYKASTICLAIFIGALTAISLADSALADDVNRTGQGQNTPGAGPPRPENPGEGDKPSYPGDQPAKQGTDPSSSVHYVDPRALSGKKHKESESN